SGENAQSGYITVPSFGGGTSDTEFEVLTGLFKREMGTSMVAYSLIRKDVDALPQRLKDIGYDTLAIHPGFSWFYNRINVYDYMGFDKFIHLESFQGSEKYKGGYIADKYATDCIIEEFEKHEETSDAPFFQFCVTIQNHGPYEDKYEEVEKMFDTDVELTEHQQELLNSYFMGVRDADIEIKRLTDYFESINEPVVIVYFGDHLPGFSNGMEFFDLLDYEIDADGTDDEAVNVYKTPYFIWQNSAAAESTDFVSNKDILTVPDNTMNAAYLGAYAFELMGMDNISPTFNYVNELRKEIPVIANGRYKLADGTYIYELNEEQQEKMNVLKKTVYNKIIE
ncbi:MAG: LTA synthase family protein, partial [Firmicutes bacterium]|nr:LTA synthase family protein [Bacillota bacterium]